MTAPARLECVRARRAIHERLDAGGRAVARPPELDDHVAVCATCRELEADLLALDEALETLPPPGMPDPAFQAVLARTSRAPVGTRERRRAPWPALAAAAAALIAAVVWLGDRPDEPSPIEVQRAAAEARLVLGLTARALDRTTDAAVHDVLEGEVGPALRRMPIDLTPDPAPDRRRSKT
jgi:hypothetical protein